MAPPAPGETDALVGEVIADRYRIERLLGRGGMGVVYLAQHVVLEKRVAIKLLPTRLARTPELFERFLQEAKAASRIGHENVVDVIDFGATPDYAPFFVMEYLDGRDLADALRQDGPFPWERACAVGRQVCDGLEAAHAHKIAHRDLKPANVFLVERGGRPDLVKVLDFGVAKVLDGAEERLTRAGTVLGTPAYMAPEQAREDAADHRVDVYALGCILYELLTGTIPFDAPTAMGIFSKHLFDPPEPLRVRAPARGIPAPVEEVVLRAMAKEPGERFPTMAEMSRALSRCLGVAPEAREPTAVRHRRLGTAELIVDARAALYRDYLEAAFLAAEAAVAGVGDLAAPELAPHADLLERVYERALGDRSRCVTPSPPPSGLDGRAVFLLSRLDTAMTLEDLLDVSAMPRLAALRLVATLLRDGTLTAHPAR